MTIKNKFDIGDSVVLIHDPEQTLWMVVYIQINANGLLYGLACGAEESTAFEFELQDPVK